MKKYLFIVLLIGVCFSQKSYNEKHLVEQDGVWYKKFSDEVVNGNVFKEIDGMEAPLGKIKNGKKEGKWTIWRNDGTKSEEQYYKDGKKDGKWTIFSAEGKVKQITTYVDGNVEELIPYYDDGSLIDNANILCIETKFGLIVLSLFPDIAPKHVENFKLHAKNGYYDGTTFHRIIPGFMIQGGDPLSKSKDKRWLGTGGDPAKFFGIGDETDKKTWGIPAEFSSTSHERGIVSMARSQNPNSARSQFFICVENANFLDNQYTAFGKVVDGMNVVDQIVKLPRDARDNPEDRVEMKFILCQ